MTDDQNVRVHSESRPALHVLHVFLALLLLVRQLGGVKHGLRRLDAAQQRLILFRDALELFQTAVAVQALGLVAGAYTLSLQSST